MKPLIAVNCDFEDKPAPPRRYAFAYQGYLEAIEDAGGIPILLPPLKNPGKILEVLQRCSGLLLTGGNDLDPSLYGESAHPKLQRMDLRKQETDLALTAHSRSLGMPTLGICYGLQLLSVETGGSLIQDISTQAGSPVTHRPDDVESAVWHEVEVERGSRLERIFSARRFRVNSSHHQAVRNPGPAFRITARSADDGIVEGLEEISARFCVGVQWHPERMLEDPLQRKLFAAFVEEAGQWPGATIAAEPAAVGQATSFSRRMRRTAR